MEFMGGGDLASVLSLLKEQSRLMSENIIAFIAAEVSLYIRLTR